MKVYLEVINNKYLRLNYISNYATGSKPVNNPIQLVEAIEEVFGKGSSCLYRGKDQEFAEWVGYDTQQKNTGKFPKISFFVDALKTQAIEECREVAKKLWGDIPELQIGWLENQCKSYIEDIENI